MSVSVCCMLIDAMARGQVEAMICRAPEFYGPDNTQSITNTTILDRLLAGKSATVFLRDDVQRSLIYTPDAYGQTWHLPCDDNRLTYRQLVSLAAGIFGVAPRYRILKRWQLRLAGYVNKTVGDAAELLPRYQTDNLFISDKFKARFPDFQVTPFAQGLHHIRHTQQKQSQN